MLHGDDRRCKQSCKGCYNDTLDGVLEQERGVVLLHKPSEDSRSGRGMLCGQNNALRDLDAWEAVDTVVL